MSAGISEPLNENWKSILWYFEQIKQFEQTKEEMLYLMFKKNAVALTSTFRMQLSTLLPVHVQRLQIVYFICIMMNQIK